jgi:hypothetical protein
MILTIMIIPPISFAVTFALIGPPFPFHDRGTVPNSFGPNFNPVFGIARMIPFLISIVWLGMGIWQWFVLSKWTKRYERYKELQKSIDEKLSNEDKGERKIDCHPYEYSSKSSVEIVLIFKGKIL